MMFFTDTDFSNGHNMDSNIWVNIKRDFDTVAAFWHGKTAIVISENSKKTWNTAEVLSFGATTTSTVVIMFKIRNKEEVCVEKKKKRNTKRKTFLNTLLSFWFRMYHLGLTSRRKVWRRMAQWQKTRIRKVRLGERRFLWSKFFFFFF